MSSATSIVVTETSDKLPKLGYSMKEAVKITGLGKSTLWQAVYDGELQHFKIGRRILFSEEHLRTFLQRFEKRRRGEDRTKVTERR